ncbi:B12-binding domain-containing radical SAM protein [Candidatus Eisenbacteria bacterium]|uniref:B12-binding domain-containing radical SAM protein n=1 Tax=Eiseniibacteriota bacterium TaxID=2212470 RepID=A0ABV6YIA9_UNCEI
MADITLVNMNMLYIKYLDGRIHRQCHLPLGPLYLVSALRAAGVDVDFRDYQLLEAEELFEPDVLCDFLADPAPVIGISCMANLLPFVLYALPAVRARYPHSKIVLGGVGPAAIEQHILERVGAADVISRGEGEINATRLVRALNEGSPLSEVPGIWFRSNGDIRRTEQIPRVQDLDALPRPSYEELDFKKYVGHNILGSRGCPYPCSFCSITPIWGWKAFSRSNEDIIAEMQNMHHEHGVRQFLFQDEYFVSSPERMIDFSRRLKQAGLPVTYKAFARVDLVNQESMRAMADSGCVEIRFGLESGSDRVLERTRKGFDTRRAFEVVSLANKIFRSVDAFYVWGFPFETSDDFNASLFQMITLRGMGVRVLPSLLTYLPQTRIFEEIPDPGRLEFCHHLLPEYMISGIESRGTVRVKIDEKYAGLFDFVMSNRDIFPGFFHLDVESNIHPKLELLEEFEFYKPLDRDPESCGAHSPTDDEHGLTLNA